MKRRAIKPAFFILITLAVFCASCTSGSDSGSDSGSKSAPEFRHDGYLEFLRKSGPDNSFQLLSTLDIEVVSNPADQSKGLKYRSAMGSNQGMLFVFPFEAPQSFWMQDTRISLDIVFVNRALQIVHIAPATTPFSEESIPSEKPAQYVVEVNAGYCREHDIRSGDYIRSRPKE